MNKQSATLQFQANMISSLGAPSNTYRNVPIRDILGEMYDKYNKFKLVLNYHSGNITNITSYSVRISGLDFINTMEYKTDKSNQKSALFMLPQNTGRAINQIQENYGAVFRKPANNKVDITISMLLTSTMEIPNYNTGSQYFVFSIYGIEE